MISKQNNYKLNDGWNLVELKELVDDPKNDIVDGPFGSNLKANEYVKAGVPVFKVQGVKANALFFDNKPASKDPWTKEVWIHDFRTNVHLAGLESFREIVETINGE